MIKRNNLLGCNLEHSGWSTNKNRKNHETIWRNHEQVEAIIQSERSGGHAGHGDAPPRDRNYPGRGLVSVGILWSWQLHEPQLPEAMR
jgi:hypothetical protein